MRVHRSECISIMQRAFRRLDYGGQLKRMSVNESMDRPEEIDIK